MFKVVVLKFSDQQAAFPPQEKRSHFETRLHSPESLSRRIKKALHEFSFSQSISREYRILRTLSHLVEKALKLPEDSFSDPALRKLVGFAALQTGSALATRKKPPEHTELLLLRGLAKIKETSCQGQFVLWGLTTLAELYLKTGQISHARSICSTAIDKCDPRWSCSGQLLEVYGKVVEAEGNHDLANRYRMEALAHYDVVINRQTKETESVRAWALYINLAQDFIDTARQTPSIRLKDYTTLVTNLEHARSRVATDICGKIAHQEAKVHVGFALLADRTRTLESKNLFYGTMRQLQHFLGNERVFGLSPQDKIVVNETLAQCHIGLALGEKIEEGDTYFARSRPGGTPYFILQITSALSCLKKTDGHEGTILRIFLDQFEQLLDKADATLPYEMVREFRRSVERKASLSE